MWLWAAAKTVVGSLFSPGEGKTTGGKLLEDMSSGIDKAFYTTQEIAKDGIAILGAKQKAFDSWIRINEAMKASEANRSVTRRVLAIGATVFIFGLISLCVASEMYSMWRDIPRIKMPLPWAPTVMVELSQLTVAIVTIATVFSLGTLLICIFGFYFGPPLFNAMRGK